MITDMPKVLTIVSSSWRKLLSLILCSRESEFKIKALYLIFITLKITFFLPSYTLAVLSELCHGPFNGEQLVTSVTAFLQLSRKMKHKNS